MPNWTKADLIAYEQRRKNRAVCEASSAIKSVIEKICQHCGKSFEAGTPAQAETRKYCSPSCAYASPGRLRNSPKPKDRGCAICKECGTTFKLTTRGGRQFCSAMCSSAFLGRTTMAKNRLVTPRTKYIQKICQHCGREFQSWQSNNRKFCSTICSSKVATISGSETKHRNGWYKSAHPYSRAKRGVREIGGKQHFFRSRMEANYARYLVFSGIQWEFEPTTFWFDGIKRGVRSYTPDFFLPVTNVYIELKGWMDKKSLTKLKRMKKYHPSVVVQLVDWKQYQAIQKTVGKIIKDWEW